jgi:hypothetical protein
MRQLIVLLLAGLFFSSCSTSYRDTQAVGRVLGKQELRDRAYKALLAEHPCANDSTSHSDSVFIAAVADTTGKQAKIDSLAKALAIAQKVPLNLCDQQVQQAFQAGFNYAKEKLRPDTIYKHTSTTVVDNRALASKAQELDQEKGKNQQLTSDLQNASKWKAWFIILACVSVLVTTILIILLMRKP